MSFKIWLAPHDLRNKPLAVYIRRAFQRFAPIMFVGFCFTTDWTRDRVLFLVLSNVVGTIFATFLVAYGFAAVFGGKGSRKGDH